MANANVNVEFFKGDINTLTENQKTLYQSIKGKIAAHFNSKMDVKEKEVNEVLSKASQVFQEYVNADWC